MIHSILVVGGGSAGLLTALILKKSMPQLKITVVRSREIGVIGVGESTTRAIPRVLHGHLGLDPGEFHRRVMPSWKLGIRFLWGSREFFDYTFTREFDWRWVELNRPNGYYCDDDLTYIGPVSSLMSHNKVFAQDNGLPLVRMNYGYHIENRRFVAYLEETAAQRDITVMDGVVTGAIQDDHGITSVLLASGQSLSADLYVDCSGFRSLLIGETLKEPYRSFKSTLFCDRAIVGSWMRGHDEVIRPFTTAETMSAGWCWQIDHPDCINRGYVYSSSFIDDEQAEAEFRQKNAKVSDAKVVRFLTGRFERAWVKNVVAIGNAVGFVEPLESTGLQIISDAARILAGCLSECERSPRPSYVRQYNRIFSEGWEATRDFLGIHFKFNTRYDTPFWKAARAETVLGSVQELIDFYQESGPSSYFTLNLLPPNSMFGMEGYFALLIGQKVPYRARYSPTAEEKRIWDLARAKNRTLAQNAVGVREALDVVARPDVKWDLRMFNTAAGAQLTNYVDAY